MAKDAIEGCLEVLKEEGQPIPPDDNQMPVKSEDLAN